jgi:hypothetical protein
MKNIVSVSRRTDVPAFYREWFRNRITKGYAGYVNPFGRQKYLVSLKPENVIAFVFWSRNYGPFLEDLRQLDKNGYRFYFNFTITGLPNDFEPNVKPIDDLIGTCKKLATRYSPKHINWRYDPIIISNATPPDYHVERFGYIAKALESSVERCYFSFPTFYCKVKKNLANLRRETGIDAFDPNTTIKQELAGRLADIGSEYGICLYTCCGDYLISNNISKASCVDAGIIAELFYGGQFDVPRKPTRKECGCFASIDIGAYDTCVHGCVYCYANMNKATAIRRYGEYDPSSAFLGYSKDESGKWVKELVQEQATLF